MNLLWGVKGVHLSAFSGALPGFCEVRVAKCMMQVNADQLQRPHTHPR